MIYKSYKEERLRRRMEQGPVVRGPMQPIAAEVATTIAYLPAEPPAAVIEMEVSVPVVEPKVVPGISNVSKLKKLKK